MEMTGIESPVRLKTPRLLLREFEEEDLLQVHEYLSDPEVFRYMIGGSADQHQSKESIQKIIEARSEKPRLDYSLVVTLKEKDRVIGGSRVRILDPTVNIVYRLLGPAYIGFWLNRLFWRQGYGTEVAKALLSFGFDELRLQRIFAWCDAENISSVKILEKIGMRREGVFVKNWMVRDNWRDAFLYAILDSEWREIQERNGQGYRS
jgi:[ribosomal protein S5]-alanine N-acetyltransferase